MTAHKIKQWLDTKRAYGFIDCDVNFGVAEFDFIMEMAEELLKRIEEENND